MPPLPPADKVLRIVLKYTYASDTNVINRYFVRYSGTKPDNTGLNTMAGNVATAWVTNFGPLCTPTLSLEQVTITDLTDPQSGQGVNTFHHPGTRVGGVLPAGTAVMIDGRIQRRYRGGKPRIYLPCGAETDLATAQTWSTAFTTSVFTAWNAFLTGNTPPAGTTITGSVNVSYYEGFENKEGSTGRINARSKVRAVTQVDPITSYGVDPRVASQRRRNRP